MISLFFPLPARLDIAVLEMNCNNGRDTNLT